MISSHPARSARPRPIDVLRANAPATPHALLMKNAQRLVAQTFFGAMLKQMHESPFKSDLFNGGRGGEAFTALLDQHLAERMSRGAGTRIARSIVNHIERARHRAATAAKTQKESASHATRKYRESQASSGEGRPHVPADLRA